MRTLIPAAAAAGTAPVVLGWAPATAPGACTYRTRAAGQTAATTFTLASTGSPAGFRG